MNKSAHPSGPVPQYQGRPFIAAVLIAAALAVMPARAQFVDTVPTSGLSEPTGLAVDSSNNIYICDSGNNRIAVLNASSQVLSTLAGGDGLTKWGTNDGPGYLARFFNPQSIATGRGGLVVSDEGNQTIRFVTYGGTVSTLAGTPQVDGYQDGPAKSAQFSYPAGVAVDSLGNVYVADSQNDLIRKIDTNNMVTTVATGSYQFNTPQAVAVDTNNNVWVADTGNNVICLISNQVVYPIAGTLGVIGTNDSLIGTQAQFNGQAGLLWTNTTLLVCDTGNNTIRAISLTNVLGYPTYAVATVAGIPGQSGSVDGAPGVATFSGPVGMSMSASIPAVYIADSANNAVRSFQEFPAQPPVPAPVIGVVTLSDAGLSVFTPITTGVYNTWQYIAVETQAGTTLTFKWGSSFPATNGYGLAPYPGDNTSLGTLLTDMAAFTNVLPTLDISVQATAPYRQPSSTVTAQIAFKTATPTVNGTDPTKIVFGDATPNAQIYYTINGTSPTNSTDAILAPVGTNVNLNVTNDVNLQAYAVAPNYQPSAIVSEALYVSNAENVTFSPSYGYFPECVTIAVTSTLPNVYYTIDGLTPTTNDTPVAMTYSNNLYYGQFQWCNAQQDLSTLEMMGFGPGLATGVSAGGTTPTNLIGFPRLEVAAGPGSTSYIPVVVDLRSNILKTLQFRVEIAPAIGNPPPITSVVLQPISSNDYVSIIGPNPGNSPVNYVVTNYVNNLNNAYGLVIAATYSSGLDINSFGVPVMLSVKTPTNATIGQTYSLNVLYPSGTSDGLSTLVGLTNMPPQTLLITDQTYLAGDCSPPTGYNAGEFGNGELDAGDLNNIFYAYNKIRVPPLNSDAYKAMDVYPETATHIGDNLITYMDWTTQLYRTLGINTNDWIRFWTNGGFLSHEEISLTDGGTPVPLATQQPLIAEKDALSSTPPGQVWFCQASIAAGSRTYVQPGTVCSLPLSLNVQPGYSVTGLDFRAIVTPDNGGPAVGSLSYTPAPGGPSPYNEMEGLSPNDLICAWPPAQFEPALQPGSNFIGTLSFLVPSTAQAGQSYSVHFANIGGAPDDTMEYSMESFPGTAWVSSAALRAPSLTSDDWKLAFFGSLTNAAAADNVDADGDGALNYQEYLAGTNPTNAASCLQFSTATLNSAGGPAVAMSWLTAPGKTYVVESQPALGGTTWTPVNTNSGDGNNYQLLITNCGGAARFYHIRLQP